MKNILTGLAMAAILAGSITSCKKDTVLKAPGKHFSLDKFEQNIKGALGGKTVGYAYSISQSGNQIRSGAGGLAVNALDAGNATGIPHSPDKRQDLASCSKTITALTLLSIMQERNKSTQDSIINYIPKFWNVPTSSFTATTLENLMRHESGFPANSLDYASLKSFAKAGPNVTNRSYVYQNHNYAWLRIVIAYMAHGGELQAMESTITASPNNETILLNAINGFYQDEVNKRVLAPCGIAFSRPAPTGETNPTLNYNFNSPATPGWNKGNMIPFAGSAGWRLSANEQNAIMANLKYTEKILNATWKQKMNDRLLGWEQAPSVALTGGQAFMHGGYFEDKFSPNAASAPAGRGCFTVHALFPNNYECAIQVNSLGGTGNMDGVVTKAYEGAWVED